MTNIPFKFDFEILLECEGTQDKKKKKSVLKTISSDGY